MYSVPLPSVFARTFSAVTLLALGVWLTPRSSAQTVVPPAHSSPASTKESPVTLTPFEVTAGTDVGYESSTAMSGTRTNESLANLPNSISVINSEFMADLGITDFFQAVEFAVGADNIYNDNMQVGAPVGARSGNQINFRGLPSVRQLKDGFPTYTPQDAFNTERIEISRGPGGIAYGDTDATGVINLTTKRGRFRNEVELQARYDDRGSQRLSADISRVLIDKSLALRLNLLDSDLEGWHENTARTMRAAAGALRYQPFKSANTIVDATYEEGRLLSFISHTALNDITSAYVRGTGTNARDANPTLAGVQTNGVGMARLAAPRTATADTHAMTVLGGRIFNLQTMGATDAFPVYRVSTIVQGANATSATDPQNPNRIPWLPIPGSLFPLHQDWAGPDARVRYKYDVANLSVQHAFSRQTSLWLAYNRQNELTDQRLTRNGNVAGSNARAVFIDVNPRLPDPAFPNDPTRTIANPNFEQLFIPGTIQRRFEEHSIESVRLIGVHNLEIGQTSHRLILSANHRDEIYRIKNMLFGLTKEEIDRRGFTGISARLPNNVVTPWYYFKDGNGEGLRIPQQPGVLDYFVNGTGGLQYFDQSLSTAVFQHLGTFFKGRLRTSLGVSRDHWQQARNLATRSFGDYQEWRFVDAAGSPLDSDADTIPTEPIADSWRTNTTYGAVYHLTDWVSLTASYQETALFTDNVGTDLYGAPRRPTAGSGVDLGLRFHLLGGRVNASIISYDNTSENNRTTIGAALRTEVNDALNTGRSTASPDQIIGLDDSNDRDTRGWELELTANLSRNWTSRLGFSTTQNQRASSVPQFRAKVALAEAHLRSQQVAAGDIQAALAASRDFLEDQDSDDTQPKQYRGSLVSRYDIREGRLRGLGVGASLRWARGRVRDPGSLFITGQLVIPERRNADEFVFSPFFKYSAKFGPVRWTGQLNLDNVFNNVTNQGRIARYPRYTEPRQITLTNFFRF
ncbi:TonB-dependent siderophore receptor [Horticoccus sp. 23ND18S-11]|uniref:TonB-dependent siderophore receptor n=1 Tax=Horticoccus sp. 23ND18S-11 TaxID=3391832 RepID=UPI0039C8EC9B